MPIPSLEEQKTIDGFPVKKVTPIESNFLMRWKKTDYAYFFRLSNKFIQLCFKDRTELFIDTVTKQVIFVPKSKEPQTFTMKEASEGDNYELHKRFKYAQEVLTKQQRP